MSPVPSVGFIRLSRRALTNALWLVAGGIGLSACSDSSGPTALKLAGVTATNDQTAIVGGTLPLPLSVRVQSDNAPRAGVTVTWEASAGTIVPARSLSDAAGLASATWTLGMEPGIMTAVTRVEGADGSPVFFRATAVAPRVTATPVASSNGQTGVVGTTLALPLRVQVRSEGVPKAGATVHWHARSGSLSPSESTTDDQGFASAAWTLGTVAGTDTASVTIVGGQASSERFTARALPGPAFAVETAGGADQTFPANHASPQPLVAMVKDQYGNGIPGQAVIWSIEQGPIAFARTGGATDAEGRSVSLIAPTGAAGGAVVRAALAGTGLSTDFALTVAPPTFEVLLSADGGFSFVSSQNGSSPAVDTIPAGRTITWTLEYFDYDQHAVAPVGTPTFQGGDFSYANPSIVSATFPTPGTYHYAEPFNPGATGTVVVQ
jgi:plastocyanin